jgi:hypothetical protein
VLPLQNWISLKNLTNNKNLTQRKTSKAKITKISSKGEVIINFSQQMMIPPNITGINENAL